jgi:predicted homoserine dehydrogenase-like protein
MEHQFKSGNVSPIKKIRVGIIGAGKMVQLMLGHARITASLMYADVDEEKIMDDTEGWQERLNKK